MKRYLAFDIGGTFIKHGIIREDTEIISSGKVRTPETLEELLQIITGFVHQENNTDIEGIAISAPGAVSAEGVIYGDSALPYLHGPNIKQLITERTSLPVHLENDANCAGYAEMWGGAAKGQQDVLVIVLGTGIGGAIIKNGSLHKGAHLYGGEFGSMLMNSDVQDGRHLWSCLASTASIVRRVIEAKQLDENALTGKQVFQMAEEGDTDSIRAIDEFYHMLALGIYNLQYIYDPELILIGGGISERKDLVDRVNEKLDKLFTAVQSSRVRPNISVCKYRQGSNLLGAVYGFIKDCDKLQ